MKRSQDHTRLKRLAAISLVLMMCLSVVPFMAPSASAVDHYPNQWDNRTDPGYLSDQIINIEQLDVQLRDVVVVDGIVYGITTDHEWLRSADYGETWTTVSSIADTYPSPGTVHSIHYSPVWDAVFISIGAGIYASYDLGVTWEKVMHLAHNGWVYQRGFGESPNGVLYIGQYGSTRASAGGWGEENYAYVNRSIDGGRTWESIATIYCYHIHAVEVGHDGTIWISYGDNIEPTYTSGLHKIPPGGSPTNVTSMWLSQPTSILRTPTSTLFGSDNMNYPSIYRWDGIDFEPTLMSGLDPSIRSWYCDDMLLVDGVIYAIPFTPKPTDRLGNAIFASIDDGRSWYNVWSEYEPSPVHYSRMLEIAGEDGHPYIYYIKELDGGGHAVYRFSNIGETGIRELMYGQRSAGTIDSTYTATVYINNGKYDVPLSRNPIRDPVIQVYGHDLSSIITQDPTETYYPTRWHSSDGLTIAQSTAEKTVGANSIMIDAAGYGKNEYVMFQHFFNTPTKSSDTYVISFDAKKSSNSEKFELRVSMDQIGGTSHGSRCLESFYLTNDWTTYTVKMSGPANDGATSAYIIFRPSNQDNQTAYIDNVKLWQLPYDDALGVDLSPDSLWPYGAPQPVADVTISVDGAEATYAGPYNDLELIDTIQLTGDYYDHIPLSAYGDGAVRFVVTGERIGYAYSSVVTRTDDGIELRGGGAAANYRSYDGWVYGGGVTEIRPGYTMTYRLDDVTTSLTEVMMVSSSGPATISNVDVGRSTITWEMGVNADSTMVYTIPGMTPGWEYTLVADGRAVTSAEAGADGVLVIEHDAMAGLYTMEIRPSSMTIAMDSLYSTIGIVAVLAVLGGLITMVGRLKF